VFVERVKFNGRVIVGIGDEFVQFFLWVVFGRDHFDRFTHTRRKASLYVCTRNGHRLYKTIIGPGKLVKTCGRTYRRRENTLNSNCPGTHWSRVPNSNTLEFRYIVRARVHNGGKRRRTEMAYARVRVRLQARGCRQ